MIQNLILGDCLEELSKIPDNSIDLILTDPPFGITSCEWDIIIPFDKLWKEYYRIIKLNTAIILFSSQPFTTKLINSNINNFKYVWIWNKKSISNPQLAKFQPLKCHEEICVFSNGKIPYFPQGVMSCSKMRKKDTGTLGATVRKAYEQTTTGYPKSILEFSVERVFHPTQKPVKLLEYLIKTYTNEENSIILDSCAGSGSTLVAAKNLNRRFIGIEKEERYFNIAKTRLSL